MLIGACKILQHPLFPSRSKKLLVLVVPGLTTSTVTRSY